MSENNECPWEDEPKFSQCPWVVGSYVWPDGYEDPDEPFVQIGGIRWSPDKVGDPGSPQQKYDARLMAAAPELYAALEAFLGWTQSPLEDSGEKLAAGLEQVTVYALAALAKARGEQ